MTRRLTLVAALCVVVWPSIAGAAGAPSRYALVLGNNVGEPPAANLRYAEDDARRFATVLTELGGYRAENVRVVVGQTADIAQRELSALEAKVAAARRHGRHVTLLLYYSGHARDGDLWMNGSRLALAELRRRLRQASADVRIGIVDACEAGALTRLKGGRRGPSFLFEPDDRVPAQGLILISSSADDEASQESDELGGSFFTHYLTSGLRGDADESGEGRVTLGEAYAYAYHRTVAVTAGTRSGPQHPTYRFDLEGHADVVLTDVSHGRSGIVFSAALFGRYMVFDQDRGRVAAEIDKRNGETRRLALPTGSYVLKKRMDDHLLTASFRLPDGQFHWVDDKQMKRVAFEDDPVKGLQLTQRWSQRPLSVRVHAIAVVQGFLTADARDTLFPTLPMYGLGIDIGPLLGAQIGLEAVWGLRNAATVRVDGLDLRQDYWQLETAVSVGFGGRLGDFGLYGGPRIAGQYVQRRFPDDAVLMDTVQDHFGFSPALFADARWYASKTISVGITGRLGVLLFGVDDNRALPFAEGGLTVGITP